MYSTIRVPRRYVPNALTRKDRLAQIRFLKKSRKQYLSGKYYKRPALKSFKNRSSNHIRRAEKMYGVTPISPSTALAKATKCSVSALDQIVKKGEGAYYSSGSRPNQTAQSWGFARLASAITGGKASTVDFHILDAGCNHKTSRAYKMARRHVTRNRTTIKLR